MTARRALPLLGLLLAAACGGKSKPAPDTVRVATFQAAPADIQPGQGTTLVFAVEPADAQVTISGLGDQTGRTSAAVTPAATTTYTLTATKGTATATATATVTVTPQVRVVTFQAAPDAIELGQSATLAFAVDPSGAQVTISGLGDQTGHTSATVTPAATTTYTLTAAVGTATATATATVTVNPRSAVALRVAAAGSATAGDALAVTVTALDASGAVAPGYRGTVHLTSSDPQAVLPADLTFGAADAGVRQVQVTLRSAGLETVAAADTVRSALQASAAVSVGPGAAASCAVVQAPASAVAGAELGLSVAVRDAFGNAATGYAGTMALTSSDPNATLPAPVAYLPGLDAGLRPFSATLFTAGAQTLTATDAVAAALTCTAPVTVSPARPTLLLALQAHANAAQPVPVGVTVQDLFANRIAAYAGTVTFTSSDAGTGAVTPAALVFTGAENGAATTSATFTTLGPQTLSASDGGSPAASGSAAVSVHGLVYTDPTAGRVRLVRNAAGSTTSVVQLDLVATEQLEVSTFFGGGPSSFAAGMNLPLDTTRVGPGATLFTPGTALPAGAGLRAAAGAIGATDHVLYTAVAKKRVAGTLFTQFTVVPRNAVFYSVRLALLGAATVGPVFDGAQPSPLYRAAVRDQWGDDFVRQDEFGVGRLEVR